MRPDTNHPSIPHAKSKAGSVAACALGLALAIGGVVSLNQAHTHADMQRLLKSEWPKVREAHARIEALASSLSGQDAARVGLAAASLKQHLDAAEAAAKEETKISLLPWLLIGLGGLVATLPCLFLFRVHQFHEAESNRLLDRIRSSESEAKDAVAAERSKAESDRKALSVLQKRQDLLRTVFSNAPVILWATDRDHNLLLWEGGAGEAFSSGTRPAIGAPVGDTHSLLGSTADEVGRALNGEVFTAEARVGDRWFSTRFSPLRTDGDAISGVCGVSADITARKRSEAANLQEEGIRQAARLKTEFMANMSHELRTPMNGIVGMVGLLGSTSLSDEQQGMLDVIQSSTDSLLQTVNNILDVAKLESGKVRLAEAEFDLGSLVLTALSSHALAAQKRGLELIADIDAGSRGRFKGDPDRISQAVGNLVENAVKFTKAGHVLVQVRSRAMKKGNFELCISVSDTGCGIPSERLAGLLKPHAGGPATLARRVGDAGFGLPIAKMVVELLGGTLRLESEEGRGTLAECSFTLACVAPGRQPGSSLSGRRVLIVDDSEVVRGILALKLSLLGAKVDVVSNGPEAHRRCLEKTNEGASYHLVLVDRFMPHMDGAAFASLLRSESSLAGTPLVLLNPNSTPLEPAKQRLFQAKLDKPVDDTRLAEVLGQCLAKQDVPGTGSDGTVKPSGPKRPLKLLVADDNSVNQAVCKKMLERLGHSVRLAANGREVLNAVAQEPYDAIFMDCQMPEVDGYEATRMLRGGDGASRDLWVVAATANASVADRENCFDAGMNDFITKPLRIEAVEAALSRIPTR